MLTRELGLLRALCRENESLPSSRAIQTPSAHACAASDIAIILIDFIGMINHPENPRDF